MEVVKIQSSMRVGCCYLQYLSYLHVSETFNLYIDICVLLVLVNLHAIMYTESFKG